MMTASNRSNRVGMKNSADSFVGIGVSPYFSKKAISLYKENLSGLSGFCRLVMYELFEYIDFESGTIAIDSLDILARTDFHVDSLRGRKKEDVTGDTIRNALRSIKKAKSDHFKFTTVNQRILIEMPFIRELYESIFNQTSELAAVVATDVAAVETLTQSRESMDLEPLLAEDVSGVLAAASLNDTNNVPVHACAKIKTNLTQNNNEQTRNVISDSFFPSQNTLERAFAMGFDNAADLVEIQAFIDHNTASGSVWADFNPIYLRWLAQSQVRRKDIKNTTVNTRSNTHGTCRKNDKNSLKQRVIAAHSGALEFRDETGRFNARYAPESAPIRYLDCNTLGPIN